MAWSASGTGAIDARHPLALGLVARNGPYQANHAARTADVLLALGVRFDDRTSSSWLPGYSFTIPPTRLIHVNIDPDEIARNYPVALGLMADVRTFLRQLLGELATRRNVSDVAASHGKWLGLIEGYRKQWNAFIAPGFDDDTTPINPQRAAHEIDRALPDDAILVSDIGVHHNWLIQFCTPKRPDSLIGSMGFGPMGFGVAGVLGAQFAAPERPCVSVCGDGAFFMHASVLGTAVEYDLPVVWVVWNNFAYASIRGLQRGYLGGRELATDFRHPAERRALQSRLCGHGARGRHRRRQRRSCRRPCRCPARGGRGAAALSHQRQYRSRQGSRRRRSVGASRARPEPAGLRRPLPAPRRWRIRVGTRRGTTVTDWVRTIVNDPRTERVVMALDHRQRHHPRARNQQERDGSWDAPRRPRSRHSRGFRGEIAARIIVHRMAFFRDPWSVFDFVVVGIALVPAAETFSVLRALRILRVLRLITAVPTLKRVVAGLWRRCPAWAPSSS